jgi:hypothetical protein
VQRQPCSPDWIQDRLTSADVVTILGEQLLEMEVLLACCVEDLVEPRDPCEQGSRVFREQVERREMVVDHRSDESDEVGEVCEEDRKVHECAQQYGREEQGAENLGQRDWREATVYEMNGLKIQINDSFS